MMLLTESKNNYAKKVLLWTDKKVQKLSKLIKKTQNSVIIIFE